MVTSHPWWVWREGLKSINYFNMNFMRVKYYVVHHANYLIVSSVIKYSFETTTSQKIINYVFIYGTFTFNSKTIILTYLFTSLTENEYE